MEIFEVETSSQILAIEMDTDNQLFNVQFEDGGEWFSVDFGSVEEEIQTQPVFYDSLCEYQDFDIGEGNYTMERTFDWDAFTNEQDWHEFILQALNQDK